MTEDPKLLTKTIYQQYHIPKINKVLINQYRDRKNMFFKFYFIIYKILYFNPSRKLFGVKANK